MTDSTTGFDRAHAPYRPPSDGYDQRMEAARAALVRGDREGAEEALANAVAIAERTPDGTAALAAALSRLGEVKHQHGKEGEAEQLFRRALEINEGLIGPEHPDLVVLLNDLSRLYLKRGAYADAEPLLLRLHAIKLTKGEDHPEVATVLASLASVRQALGRYDSAEQLWRRVLEIRERTLAPHHFSIATALEHLGETCAARGKLSEALRYRIRALAMREMTLDPGHPSLRVARERIADLQLQASEEAHDAEMPDADGGAPIWLAPVASAPVVTPAPPPIPAPVAASPVTPLPPAHHPAYPSPAAYQPPVAYQPPLAAQAPVGHQLAPAVAPPPAPVPRPVADRRAPMPLVDDEAHDEDPEGRNGQDAGGLHLVSVAGIGDASRSVIMPYYADALALAGEAAADDALNGRQATGIVAGALAFLRGRRNAVVAGVGATALVLGAIGAQSFANDAVDETAVDEGGGFRAAPVSAAVPEEPGPIAESVIAAGTVEREAGVTERTAERSRRPDESPKTVSPRQAEPDGGAAAPSLPAGAALPRAINVRLDSVAQSVGSAIGAPLAAKVSLPANGRMSSVASTGNAESQPALLIVSPTPVYPASLYTKNFAGSASVEFVIDTNGRVDVSTFKSQANHELFTEAVRHILPDMRFVASTRNGRKVRSTMRMRFEFDRSGVSTSRSN